MSSIFIAVPQTTQWQPEVILQLTEYFIANSYSINLQIIANADAIFWKLEVPRKDQEKVVNALYAFYPGAHIEILTKHIATGYVLRHIQALKPFTMLFKSIDEFKRLDPLVPVLGAMTNLRQGEDIIYQLSLSPPTQDYKALGEKLLRPAFEDIFLDVFLAATNKGHAKTEVQKRIEKERLDVQNPAREKLKSYLTEVVFSVKIGANSWDRGNFLASTIASVFSTFDGDQNEFFSASEHTYPLVLSAPEVAALWHLPTDQCQTPGILWATWVVAPIPRELIHQDQGVKLGTNVYQGRFHPVRLTYPDRVTHVNLIGKTRVGKSTLLHHMVHQDIAAGKGVAVIDPQGDLVDAILASSIPETREQDVVLFDTRDQDYSIGLNLLTIPPGVSPDATASYALAVIRKMFADQWSGVRMETVLDAALRALVAVPGSTIQDIPKLLLDAKFRRQVLKQVADPTALDFWHDEYDHETVAQQREFARPINHRIRKFYRDPTIRGIVCQRGSLNIRHILDHSQIFLANLGGVADIEAETLGALLISKIQMAAMSRAALAPEQRTPFYLYVDEVQNFITTSLSKMFSEAGKYGLSLVVANQFLKQLEGDTLDALMGNVGTTLIFGVGPKDAQALTSYVKPHFNSENLVNLDRFETVVKMQLSGLTLPAFSMLTKKPLTKLNDASERIERIRQYSRTRYARRKDEIDAELMNRYDRSESAELGEAGSSYFD